MQAKTVITITGYGVLALLAGISFLMPRKLTIPTAAADPPPTEIRLTGTVRDFRAVHPDFDVVPAAGAGHYAGTLRTTLDASGRPVLADGGPGEAWRDDGDDLVANWKLDDGGGTTAADFLGANPGTLVNGPTWVAGQDGGALHFDGVNDYVEIPSSPETQINGDVTCTGWFKLDEDFDGTSPNTLVIMEKFLDTEHDFHIGLAGGDYNRPEVAKGALVFKIENGPDSDHYRYKWTNRTSWTAGVWYHFAATVFSADTSQNVLFIDGVDDTSPTDAGGVGFIDTDYDAPLRIGGKTIDYNGLATDIFFKGSIDDVKFFRRALETEDFTPPTDGGFKVAAQWTDSSGRPIAHLSGRGEPSGPIDGLRVRGSIAFENDNVIDSFDSRLGPYGGANVGANAVLSTNSTVTGDVLISGGTVINGDVYAGAGGDPGLVIDNSGTVTGTVGALDSTYLMPTVQVPADLIALANSGDVDLDSGVMSTDLHADFLKINDTTVLEISGDVRFLCENGLDVGNSAEIRLLPGATLSIYVRGAKADLRNDSKVNVDSADPTRFFIYYDGVGQVDLRNKSEVYATIIAPDAEVQVRNESQVYGSLAADSLIVRNHASAVHMDVASRVQEDACGNTIADADGVAGTGDTGGISSADTLSQWFRDVLGANQSSAHTITLALSGAGVYSYLTDAFYPLDGRGFGNEGDTHNNHFTYHIRARFQHNECRSDFVEFEGGDGVWIFIDGKLAIDLGGVGAIDEQYVALDRLGLTDGETYTFHLFFAQRQDADVPFRLRTTLELSTEDDQRTVSAMFD